MIDDDPQDELQNLRLIKEALERGFSSSFSPVPVIIDGMIDLALQLASQIEAGKTSFRVNPEVLFPKDKTPEFQVQFGKPTEAGPTREFSQNPKWSRYSKQGHEIDALNNPKSIRVRGLKRINIPLEAAAELRKLVNYLVEMREGKYSPFAGEIPKPRQKGKGQEYHYFRRQRLKKHQ
jgi:hypothetical protein